MFNGIKSKEATAINKNFMKMDEFIIPGKFKGEIIPHDKEEQKKIKTKQNLMKWKA